MLQVRERKQKLNITILPSVKSDAELIAKKYNTSVSDVIETLLKKLIKDEFENKN